MSSEAGTSRRSSHRRENVPKIISPEAASDQSTIQNVFGFLQDYVPQAVTGQKEERRERVLWALFETGDINDVTMEHRGSTQDPLLPLLLILGFASGYSVWTVPLGGDAQEVFSVRGEGEVARVVRLLRTPEGCEGVGPDKYASQRPIMAVVKKGRHGSGAVAYSTVHFISLSSKDGGRREGGGGGDSVVHKMSFRPKIVVDLKCNRRVVVVVLRKRIVVLDAGTLESKFSIRNGYPSLGYPCNPVALATRWMAFSETKLVSKHQSVGGMSDTTPPSVATTVLKNVKKGFSALTETISGLAGRTQPPTLESANVTSQPEQTTANVVSILDVSQNHSQEVRLSELGRESGVIAHFVAHTGPNVHVAALAFNPSGTLLVSASTEGHHFHVFRILPHPWLSSEAAVHHLYTLFRGATSGLVQDICFSADSRWVAASTLNGTTHIFPITPYGGVINMRTHTSPRVVNQLSRFHTTAGIETFSTKSHANLTKTHSQSPPRESSATRDYSALPVATSYGGGSNWSNPRGLPLPTPATVSALQQIKQPYLSTAGDAPSKTPASSTTASPLSRADTGEPFVTLAGPDTLCVRATFAVFPPCEPSRGRNDSSEQTASYSLYVVGSHGVLTEHLLEPRKATEAPEGEDAPIELGHHPRVCWRLLSKPSSGSMPLPLWDGNPLVMAYSEYRKFCEKAKEGSTQTQTGPKTDGEWLSQVEILTHAPPSRRLWMGPQFSFKAYQSTNSSGNQLPAALLSPSPPTTVIYSGSLSSPSNLPVSTSGLVSPGTTTGEGGRGRSDTQGSRQSGNEEDFAPHSAMLSTTEAPLLDLLSEPLEAQNLALKTIQTSPLPMPSLSRDLGQDGMESGPPSLEPGVVEVFGSWKKVAPHLGGPHLETEQVERQLAEAMCEQDSPTVTVVAGGSGAKTGFFPLDESH